MKSLQAQPSNFNANGCLHVAARAISHLSTVEVDLKKPRELIKLINADYKDDDFKDDADYEDDDYEDEKLLSTR